MNKVDIVRKYIGNDDFYDINGTPLLIKILAAMDEYAQQQVKNCFISDVVGQSELLFAFIKTIKEEFSDQNWDYLDFIADRVIGKQ